MTPPSVTLATASPIGRPIEEVASTPTAQEAVPTEAQIGTLGDPAAAWQAIIAQMREHSKTLQAVLRSGGIMSVDGREMTVGFEYPFHREQLAEPQKRKLLEKVVEEVLGAHYRVTCVTTSREAINAASGGGVRGDDGFIEEAEERLRAFHVRQLGNGPV
jgi:aspartate ammonia-lyase